MLLKLASTVKIYIFEQIIQILLKKFIHYNLILFACICCAPQKHLYLKSSSNKSIIENEQLNILYRGIKNYLTIYVPNSDSIKVSGTGVSKEGNSKYGIIPGAGKSLDITITSFINGKELIEKREFQILNIDKPFASIGNRTGQITLSNEELANSTIKYFIPQFVIKLGKVGEFKYQINNEEPVINYNEEFNESAKERIFKMKPGDYMIIDELRFNTESQNSCLKEVTKLTVYIK